MFIGVQVIRLPDFFSKFLPAMLKDRTETNVSHRRNLFHDLVQIADACEVTRGEAYHLALLELANLWQRGRAKFPAHPLLPARMREQFAFEVRFNPLRVLTEQLSRRRRSAK